ncbi:hypothetical protein CGCSCA5_v006115 [Colletotrichum siamense]|uniref:uncharacterized protein n=1 Tax=Colletotrichum siamense TaxID=690259 RepID=UPI001872DA05|nr:uncharacterized protein CGCS363_v001227 [Colletotrichum siamense]KAI8160715.1 hypothetical protein K4K50_001945 [Colletotrichum sp. SAR 10_71]KAI8175974.1 hypothetical protein K4K49_002455 [Colletotrichum sp. SAR 10_70]KAI8179771.1 hypothetical protein K4K51_003241 [Colletotrichum sp. SAR 10_75]KAI8182058.1 hypothetical protein KHU50_002456 [Colletotrichum sp. SAR 10_65]KAI8205204.1 hypothetical protein K4K52_004404 [Colletotrichum sp. SAR 10_76]KAI8210077.1 hypothetical protein K4K53_0124
MASLQPTYGGWLIKATRDWYFLAMEKVPQKYGLSKNAQQLLQYLDDVKAKMMDEYELGRMVRMSNENRKAITDTIRKVALLMQKQPKEQKNCIKLIEMCTEILDIANRPPPPAAFPFMKFPREIRARILDMIIDQHGDTEKLQPVKWGTCNCVNPEREKFPVVSKAQKKTFKQLGMSLGDEFYDVLYKKRNWYFSCCCTLNKALQGNTKLRTYLRNAHVHWCGPMANKAFENLAKCPSLRNLTIKISKATMTILNTREAGLASFFSLNKRRLMDCLGADELLLIHGLEEVHVEHVSSVQKDKLNEYDRQGLLSLLKAKCKDRF